MIRGEFAEFAEFGVRGYFLVIAVVGTFDGIDVIEVECDNDANVDEEAIEADNLSIGKFLTSASVDFANPGPCCLEFMFKERFRS